MTVDATAALFLMLGLAADKTLAKLEDIVPDVSLYLSASYDLAPVVPDLVRRLHLKPIASFLCSRPTLES